MPDPRSYVPKISAVTVTIPSGEFISDIAITSGLTVTGITTDANVPDNTTFGFLGRATTDQADFLVMRGVDGREFTWKGHPSEYCAFSKFDFNGVGAIKIVTAPNAAPTDLEFILSVTVGG